MRLLIVENDIELLESLTNTLASNGYEVDYTNDAFLGLSYALANKYDAILINLHINKVTAKEFVSNLYAHHIYTPIIALTTKEILGMRLLNYEIVLADYLILPMYTNELLDTIKAVIDLSGDEEEAKYADLRLKKYVLESEGKVRLSANEVRILNKLLAEEQVKAVDLVAYAHNYENLWIYIDSINHKLNQIKSKVKISFEKGEYRVAWLKD